MTETHTGSAGPDPTAGEMREAFDLRARAERELAEAAETRRSALTEAEAIVLQAQQFADGVTTAAEEVLADARRGAELDRAAAQRERRALLDEATADAAVHADAALRDLVAIASSLRDSMAPAAIRLDDILDQLGETSDQFSAARQTEPAKSSRFRR